MKTPDTIYVHNGAHLGLLTLTTIPVGGPEEQQYIRKEALLEWVNKRLEEFRQIAEISNDVAADGEVDAFEELIDKLNEM